MQILYVIKSVKCLEETVISKVISTYYSVQIYSPLLELLQTKSRFELTSLVHERTGIGGHYYIIIKKNGGWYKCGDDQV